ncbi:SWIM zinc finger domain-containing protein [Methylosinus sp. PW1]|uniref:SWIM zinc finger family protein n=1 Tax=Methylosinus sp. PW1 TaxID=107636 RepID=UPI00055F639B|nr:hypothetical protein [Methylosinus sp. PW1]
MHVGRNAFGAGRIYRQQRRVLQYAIGGGSISAKVQGNERSPYMHAIVVERSAAGKTTIRSDCTCPVGSGCKRVAIASNQDVDTDRVHSRKMLR